MAPHRHIRKHYPVQGSYAKYIYFIYVFKLFGSDFAKGLMHQSSRIMDKHIGFFPASTLCPAFANCSANS
ncbi:hypothetical protein COLO4_01905 [Corchorus olitorius]|uniref:Uncharacterized protein n=1 Tax=Corchorus olitorius TaxID=93759 RepID=A0A1R3L1T7_9ROSI|nr:hypothetical protein COLO4_01905 [Corchorus olitorius]